MKINKFTFIIILFFISLHVSCQKQIAINNIEEAPVFNQADKSHADAFKILDGTWKGMFLIYQDQNIVSKTEKELKNISPDIFKKGNFKLINSIEVTQVYTSESPYFQRVTITDFYPDSGKKEISKGVNKIQDGKALCVVHKPQEVVIHDGQILPNNTIIWSRSEKQPQRIEYFKETVSDQFYEIIGWGYYEGDDPKMSPKLWFYSKYERQ